MSTMDKLNVVKIIVHSRLNNKIMKSTYLFFLFPFLLIYAEHCYAQPTAVLYVGSHQNVGYTVRVDGSQSFGDNNDIHNNPVAGYGYGIMVTSDGYAMIRYDEFSNNRHSVASGGSRHNLMNTGYDLIHNHIEKDGNTARDVALDTHAGAHGRLRISDIDDNTIMNYGHKIDNLITFTGSANWNDSETNLTITTSSLPNGTIGQEYNVSLQASNGTPSYGWSLVSGNLPAGLDFNSNGVISGIPVHAEQRSFTVQVEDATNSTARKELCITITSSVDIRFAVIGDYGRDGTPEAEVANLVKSWQPDFIITTGDNNYPVGDWATIDENIGQYYHEYIYPYKGSYGPGASTNRFFPVPGHRDWDTANLAPYLDYFTLPGNEYYYEFVWGPVHFFMLDTDTREPDGATQTSVQGQWLQTQLTLSTEPWNVVVAHHAPYTSHKVSDIKRMRWPFADWGADVTFWGYFHVYERLTVDGIPYIIEGTGGASVSSFATTDPHSEVRYNGDYGATLVEADSTSMTFRHYNRSGQLIDSHFITKMPLSIEEKAGLPERFELSQNYPNPFNMETKFTYYIAQTSNVSLTIYDLRGKKVKTLLNENREPGYYNITWDGKDEFRNQVVSGIYFAKMIAGNFSQVRKLLLQK